MNEEDEFTERMRDVKHQLTDLSEWTRNLQPKIDAIWQTYSYLLRDHLEASAPHPLDVIEKENLGWALREIKRLSQLISPLAAEASAPKDEETWPPPWEPSHEHCYYPHPTVRGLLCSLVVGHEGQHNTSRYWPSPASPPPAPAMAQFARDNALAGTTFGDSLAPAPIERRGNMEEITTTDVTKICRQWAWQIRDEAESLGFDITKRWHILKETGIALIELAQQEQRDADGEPAYNEGVAVGGEPVTTEQASRKSFGGEPTASPPALESPKECQHIPLESRTKLYEGDFTVCRICGEAIELRWATIPQRNDLESRLTAAAAREGDLWSFAQRAMDFVFNGTSDLETLLAEYDVLKAQQAGEKQ